MEVWMSLIAHFQDLYWSLLKHQCIGEKSDELLAVEQQQELKAAELVMGSTGFYFEALIFKHDLVGVFHPEIVRQIRRDFDDYLMVKIGQDDSLMFLYTFSREIGEALYLVGRCTCCWTNCDGITHS